MSVSPAWTPAREDLLRELWPSSLSTAEIGSRLGATRNAVIGKARHLGLPPKARPLRRPSPGPGASLRPPPEGARLFRLADLGDRQCRWPYDNPSGKGFLFCGDAVAINEETGLPFSYCPGHYAKAHDKKPEPIRLPEITGFRISP